MYYVVEHKNIDEVLSIVQLYYFGEKIIQVKNSFEEFNKELDLELIELKKDINNNNINNNNINNSITVIRSFIKNNCICCEAYSKNITTLEITKLAETYENLDILDILNNNINNFDYLEYNTFSKELSRLIKLTVFNVLSIIRPMKMPWGILTGIRPTKKVNELLEQNYTKEQLKDILNNKYLVNDEKINLVLEIAEKEKLVIKNNSKNKIAIYIGIPFCPTRCVYCSFTSFNLNQYTKKVNLYLDCLEKEIEDACKILNNNNNNLIESIYIGGGTPTSLNELQLERLLNIIKTNFSPPTIEYTIEAGRADTITRKKLELIKDFGATRISINPQTMNDKTLKLIGRNHLVNEFIQAFNMARDVGLNNINTDIILGLTDETSQDVEYTMQEILKLNPESLTVHTLSLKRASRLNEILDEFNPKPFYEMDKMVNISNKYASEMNMYPYYMYRQKNTLGNFENVGYCKKGYESVYNIQIMEEKQTIISFGAGATTKFYFEESNLINRVFNLKSVDEYIRRIDEMILKKSEALKNWL